MKFSISDLAFLYARNNLIFPMSADRGTQDLEKFQEKHPEYKSNFDPDIFRHIKAHDECEFEFVKAHHADSGYSDEQLKEIQYTMRIANIKYREIDAVA